MECGGCIVWNKMFKRELFDGLRFPEGRVYEDIAITHKIHMRAKRIVMIPDCLYNYVYRRDSLSHGYSVKNKRDALLSALERAEDLESFGCAKDVYEPLLFTCAITIWSITDPSENQLYRKVKEIADSITGILPYLSWKK